jgi:hypothetical protein
MDQKNIFFYILSTLIFILLFHMVSKKMDIEILTLFGFINSTLLFFNLQIALNNQIKDTKDTKDSTIPSRDQHP